MTSVSAFLLPTTEVFSTLEVKGGLHDGVAVPLERPVCRIGSSACADVMLSDAVVAAEHVTLRFHARMVAIEAVGGDVEANGRPLAQGTGWRTELPVTLTIGDVKLQLSRPELSLPPAIQAIQGSVHSLCHSAQAVAPVAWQRLRRVLSPRVVTLRRKVSPWLCATGRYVAPMTRRLSYWCAPMLLFASRLWHRAWRKAPIPKSWRQRLTRGGKEVPGTLTKRGTAITALCTSLMLVGIYQLVGVNKAGANISSISANALHSTAMLHPQAAEAARLLATTDVSAVEALNQRLAEAGLDALQVQDSGSHLVVSGQFAADRYEQWRDVQRWFDQHYGGSQVLISEARPGLALDAPAFQFQAVWFGDNPYVINAKGERLYAGAALQEGWVLAEIGDDRVTLRRGSEEFFLTL